MLGDINSTLLWKNYNGQKKLFLKIKKTEGSSKDKIIPCNPYTSKLISCLFNGLELFPITPSSNIFINDDYSNQVLDQLSEIISIGEIYTQNHFKNNSQNMRDRVDMAYLDLNENDKSFDMINQLKPVLKKNGFIILIINFKSNQFEIPKKIIQNLLDNFHDSFEIIQEINLSNYFKYSFMIMIMKK